MMLVLSLLLLLRSDSGVVSIPYELELLGLGVT